MSDPTRFDLDDRQRAMLAEMGVRVWWPQRAAAEQPQVQALAAAPDVALPVSAPAVLPVSRPAAPAPAPALALVGQPLAEGVDQMDWAALQATAASCRACDLCANRQQAVLGVGDVQADWMVIGDPPVEAEGQHGELFVGPSKQLLDNMLKAVGLSREAKGEGGVYITSSVKCPLPGSRNPSPQELATCEPYLARQVALVKPQVILLMGRFAIQVVLQSTEPLGKLRGQVHSYQGVPVVATYHPDILLRNLPDKSKAWADLVMAMKVVRGP